MLLSLLEKGGEGRRSKEGEGGEREGGEGGGVVEDAVTALVCKRLHDSFISNPALMKLLHFQVFFFLL